jgi:hypothetical protein
MNKSLMAPFRIGLGLIALLFSGSALADVRVAGRHVYILQPGENEIWGSYVFLVESSQEEEQSLPLLLPKEKTQFGPQEGMTNEELQFDETHGVVLRKKFAPGSNLFAVGFNVPGSGGKATLTIEPSGEMSDISLMVPIDSLKVEGPNLTFQPRVNFIGREFDTYVYKVGSGESAATALTFTVSGIPEGRSDYYLAAAILTLALLILAGMLAWRTMPRGDSGEEDLLPVEGAT